MKLIICKDYEEMSRKGADFIAEELKSNPKSVLGLATGSTPIGIYEGLIEKYQKGEISFRDATTFNLDEYYPISSESDQSYHYFMKENLFRHVDISPTSIHILDGETDDPKGECIRFEEMLNEAGGVDLQILGIGRNGHIGFNEPGENLSTSTHMTALTRDTIEANARFFESEKEVPKYALTMGMSTIMRAKKIILLANGHGKRDAIRRLLSDDITTNTPATMLKLHPDVTVICDYEAYSDARIGIDIGGMSAKIGLVENGEILARQDIPITPSDTAEEIVSALLSAVREMKKIRPITEVGVGTPGLIKENKVTAANLPFEDFPLKEALEKATGCEIRIENDANCAALGEHRFGAGKGTKNMLMITLGTGIGAGLIIGGRIYTGKGSAGEVGHMSIIPDGRPCPCGRKGCFEQYASVSSLIRDTREAIEANPQSILASFGKDGVNGKTIFSAMEENCPVAETVFQHYLTHLAYGLDNFIRLFEPETVLISGGVSGEGDTFLNPLKEKLSEHADIKMATLKNNAGIIGAASLYGGN